MMPSSPFAMCGGQIYLVANFILEPTEGQPSLPDLLSQLLQKHSSGELLILRPLSSEESKDLQEAREDSDIDFWAHLVGSKQ